VKDIKGRENLKNNTARTPGEPGMWETTSKLYRGGTGALGEDHGEYWRDTGSKKVKIGTDQSKMEHPIGEGKD